MTRMAEPLIIPIRGRAPEMHAESWVAPNASLIGQVVLAARASVWYGATLRAEARTHRDRVRHQHPGRCHDPRRRGVPRQGRRGRQRRPQRRAARLHVEDDASSAWARSVLNGARSATRSLVPLVPVRRELSDAEIVDNRHNAQVYQRLIDRHRAAPTEDVHDSRSADCG